MTHGTSPKICLNRERSTWQSDTGQESVIHTYNCVNYASRHDAEVALRAAVPPADVDYALPLKMVDVQETDVPDIFEGTVTYERFFPDIAEKETFSGRINTTTVNQKKGVAHLGDFWPQGDVAGYQSFGLLNETDEEVQGLDVAFPALQFTITRLYPPNTVATVANLAFAMGFVEKPNLLTWRGFAPGEVKLVNYSTDNSDISHDVVQFDFAASPTQTNVTIPDALSTDGTLKNIVVPTKRGWDYLQVKTKKKKNVLGGFDNIVVSAHLEQVQQYVDLNLLIT